MNHFDLASQEWDKPEKVELNKKYGARINELTYTNEPRSILDLGCGTGLLSLSLVKDGDSLLGIDTSMGMIDVFCKKIQNVPSFRGEILNPEEEAIHGQYNLIVSGMAFHHLHDPASVLEKLKKKLLPGGKIAIIDLDAEDGSFHPDNAGMGVKHFGFSQATLQSWVDSQSLSLQHEIIHKEEKNGKSYPIFLALFSLN